MGFDAVQDRSTAVVETLQYPESGKLLPQFWEDIPEVGAPPRLTRAAAFAGGAGDRPEATEPARIDEVKRSFEAGREQGTRQGRELERKEHETQLLEMEKKRVAQAAELVNQFANERGRFLEAVEQDVVRLALAIAERILRREAQMDPLFLVGAVRVALGQLAENMQVRLRIPAPEAELWTETMAHLPGLKVRPEIVPDPGIELGDCVIESEMGSADLGMGAQIHSIQHALFDNASTSDRREVPDGDRRVREAHP
jgi:flagellar assembly protein FliH